MKRWWGGTSAYSLVVECNSSKVVIRVRFPVGAQFFRAFVEAVKTSLAQLDSAPAF